MYVYIDLFVVRVLFAEEFSDHCLVEEILIGVKELGHFFRFAADQLLVDEVFEAFLRILIEQIDAFLEQLLPLTDQLEIVDVLRQLGRTQRTARVRTANGTTDVAGRRLIAIEITSVFVQWL